MRRCDKQPWKGLARRPHIEEAMSQMIHWPSQKLAKKAENLT
jgi:hypothetical protein